MGATMGKYDLKWAVLCVLLAMIAASLLLQATGTMERGATASEKSRALETERGRDIHFDRPVEAVEKGGALTMAGGNFIYMNR